MSHVSRTFLVTLVFILSLPTLTWAEAKAIPYDTVTVRMRDGITLSTDIYRNSDNKSAPTILVRTPYNKRGVQSTAARFVAAGYSFVVQDCRGRFESQGTFIPYNNEGQDGYDTIEWLQHQPWCNGRIAMWGSSYVGATQWQAAVEHPPGLVTILPTATWSSFYRNLYLGGAVRLSLIATWAGGNSDRPANIGLPTDWDSTLMHLPLSEMDQKMGWSIPWLHGMLTHPQWNGFWTRLELAEQILDLNLPIQHVVGYYDFFSRESVGNFQRMQQLATKRAIRKHQQLILGPWDHGTIGQSQVGDVNFGPHAQWDRDASQIAWLDHYLKPAHIPSDAFPLSPVRYFSMGDNLWQNADTWPPQGFKETPFYLHSDGLANTLNGNGTLDSMRPQQEEPHDTFVADPDHPAPACPVTDSRPLHRATWAPVDQRPTELRDDVLVYTSTRLMSPLTFAGNVQAKLFVSADTPDADWVVKLIDVHPDGFAQNIAVGLIRGSFRNSEHTSKPLVPNRMYELSVDLGPVAARIDAGHQIRVDISGAYFPLFDRNPNTAKGPYSKVSIKAIERVFHHKDAASCIILPVKQ
ncbi:MAG: CocE/NonD family hydrolase [Planctomycetota bacterium]|nr:CocE/NonD family hydrolase [Planctomycetota bacterium]